MLAARGAIAGRQSWLVAMMAGVIRFDGLPMLASLSLLLGGVVTLGSNSSTLDEAAVALKDAEAQRAAPDRPASICAWSAAARRSAG